MLALTGTKDLLRGVAGRAARFLIAVDPGGLHSHARRNAASAAAVASVHRREAQEIERWISAVHSRDTAHAAGSPLHEAS